MSAELYGYLRRYLGDASFADDVFQNTFLQMYLKRDAYEPGRPVRPWLYAIATNQAIDFMRRRGRRSAVSLEQQTGQDAEGEVHRLLDLLENRGDVRLRKRLARRDSTAGARKPSTNCRSSCVRWSCSPISRDYRTGTSPKPSGSPWGR